MTTNEKKPKLKEETNEEQKLDAVVEAKYQCPMKCEGDKTYDEKLNCPKCGMCMNEVKNY